MRRFWILISTISLALLTGSGIAQADSCSVIRNQMRAAEGASASEVAQFRRQIAAIRADERRRSCTEAKAAGGGLFNACRGLAWQRQEAERKLADARGGGRTGNFLQARYRALGCESQPRREERQARADTAKRSVPRYAGHTLYYCVRPSDGYLFPAPRSQFAKEDYVEAAVEQCRFICQDPSMALYVLEDLALETGEMLSIETKTPYRELPAAFRYQGEEFEACDWSRYFARINELRARTVTPRNLENAIIPLPTFRPMQTDAIQTSAFGPAENREGGSRKVRVVGPTFLPAKDINFRHISREAQQQNSLAKTLETLIQVR